MCRILPSPAQRRRGVLIIGEVDSPVYAESIRWADRDPVARRLALRRALALRTPGAIRNGLMLKALIAYMGSISAATKEGR
jgi:hypothetical protein